MENGYRSPQSYANVSNAVDNIGHGIFNMMAKGVTAIGNVIKKDGIFKNPETVKALDAAVFSIISASKAAVIDILNEHKDGAVHNYSNEEVQKASAILVNIESGRVPESDIQNKILGLFTIYPYDDRIYKYLLNKFGSDSGRLDAVAEYFGISSLAEEKEKIFRSKLNSANFSSVAAIQSNKSLLHAFANNIGYPGYEKDLEELLDILREKEFQQEAAKYQPQSLSDFDQNILALRKHAESINYKNFNSWSSSMRDKLEKAQKKEEAKQAQKKKEDDEFEKKSKFMQFMTSKDPSIEKKRGAIFLVLIFIIYLLYKWNP